MTSQRIGEFWKLAGKLVRLAEIGAADASGLKSHLVSTTAQFGLHTGGNALHDDVTTVIVPLHVRVSAVAGSLDRVGVLVKGSMDAYLRAIGSELNLPAAASLLQLLTTLAGHMTTASGTIAPSGKFYNYFQSRYGFAGFPTSPTAATYADSLITTTVV